MRTRNITAALPLALCVAVSMIAPSFAQQSGATDNLKPAIVTDMPDGTATTTDKIKGLVAVAKRGKFHHSFTYETVGGRHVTVNEKIKGVKDLRPEEIAHPYETKIHAFSQRWGHDLNALANGLVCLSYTIAIFKVL